MPDRYKDANRVVVVSVDEIDWSRKSTPVLKL